MLLSYKHALAIRIISTWHNIPFFVYGMTIAHDMIYNTYHFVHNNYSFYGITMYEPYHFACRDMLIKEIHTLWLLLDSLVTTCNYNNFIASTLVTVCEYICS